MTHLKHLGVALGLVSRHKGVQGGELGPGDGHHLGRGVELHGAGAQRDHGVRQRQVPVLQTLEVAQHLVLAVVQVEDGRLQVGAAPLEAAQRAVDLARTTQQQIQRSTAGGLLDTTPLALSTIQALPMEKNNRAMV